MRKVDTKSSQSPTPGLANPVVRNPVPTTQNNLGLSGSNGSFNLFSSPQGSSLNFSNLMPTSAFGDEYKKKTAEKSNLKPVKEDQPEPKRSARIKKKASEHEEFVVPSSKRRVQKHAEKEAKESRIDAETATFRADSHLNSCTQSNAGNEGSGNQKRRGRKREGDDSYFQRT